MSASKDFLSLLEEGRQLVLKEFPEAHFCEADWKRDKPQQWRFVFLNSASTPDSTVLLLHGKAGFEAPRQIDAVWQNDRVIPFPVPMKLQVAENLAKKAGFDGQVELVTLRWPLFPGSNEPCYMLGIPSQHVHVFVGVYTHQVHTAPLNV